jgi:hypothetical protein
VPLNLESYAVSAYIFNGIDLILHGFTYIVLWIIQAWIHHDACDHLEVKKSLQAANAAWNMGNWEEMTMYVECLDTHEDALVQMPVLDTSGSGNGASDGAFFRAVLCVWKGKVCGMHYVTSLVLLHSSHIYMYTLNPKLKP